MQVLVQRPGTEYSPEFVAGMSACCYRGLSEIYTSVTIGEVKAMRLI